jgi:demethylmenaquinone methyltransferase / 2-methoxy-6-polyprenyl-1,4-benzoquinol methylase
MSNNRPLQRMFMAVPPRYDLINSIFTLGMDKKWRDKATLKCLSSRPRTFLDICCGTGDLSVNMARMTKQEVSILGIDYSQPMLEKAVEKSKKVSARVNFNLIQGDSSALPLNDESIDCAGISFAFRNMTYKNPLREKHLAEVFRVLKKGGRYVIVESSQPESRLIKMFFRLYVRTFVFWIGYLISGNKGAYKYLVESVADFYTPAQIREMLINAGFSKVEYQPLFFGASGIHVASKAG